MSEFFRKSLYRPSAPTLVSVKSARQISPGLRSLTFVGEGLSAFPHHCPAAHVKIFLPRAGQLRPALPALGPNGPVWPKDEPKPIVRTYSVRSFRPEAKELDIEFAVHGVEGPATRFAMTAEPGQFLGLSYPGGPDPMIPPATHYTLVGDMSSLPAVAAILESFPCNVRGRALLRADDERDIRELPRPSGVDLRWFVSGPEDIDELAKAAIAAIADEDPEAFAWIGGEHALVVRLRRFLLKERHVPGDRLYALPYWRHRLSEESYHDIRDEVMNEAT